MTRMFAVALGILTAIGGFLDIGDLVTNAVVGSRFGLALAWVVVVGVIGICLYAQMAGRVAAVSGRATFEIIRERLGPRMAAANLGASFFINLMTVTAEIGGVALALQLATDVGPLLWVPVAAFAIWIVIWRVRFSIMENVTGLLGLSLIIFAVSLFALKPDWGQLTHQALAPVIPDTESAATCWCYAIALFGAAMTPMRCSSSPPVPSRRSGRSRIWAPLGSTCWSVFRWAGCCRWRSRRAPRWSCYPARSR